MVIVLGQPDANLPANMATCVYGTCSVGDTTLGTTVANLGMTDVRFPKPVFHGDTVRVRTTVMSVRRSKSRSDAGIVEFEHVGLNQQGDTVAICRRAALMRTRSA